MNRRTFLSFTATGAGVLSAAPAFPQPAGTTPLTIVIPFAAGGASDLVVRVLADGLARQLGRPIVTENKGGAGGLIAAAAVGRAAMDGQTLLYGNQGQMVVARHLFPGNGSDPRSALLPLAPTVRTQFLLVVPAGSSVVSAVALAASGRSGRLKFGIPGVGSPPHLATVLFAELMGAPIDVIPYQGSAPMLVDLIAGRLDAAFDNVATSLVQVRAEKLRALGTSGPKRAAIAPEIPTLAEAGIEGYAYQSWQGMFAPRGTAGEVAAGIVSALHQTLAEPATLRRLGESGLEVFTSSPSEFEALIARDAQEWDARVRKGLLRPG